MTHDALRPPAGSPPPAVLDALVRRAADEGLLDVAYAEVDSPLGPLLAARTPAGLVRLAYLESGGGTDRVLTSLSERLSPRVLEAPARLDDVRRELDEYFAGKREGFDVPLDFALVGGFTRRLLEATATIPFGAVRTYRDMAEAAGSPRAMRAAGNALSANPIPIVVPCHRVVRAGGQLGGYTGGVEKKQALLRIEGYLR